MPLTYEFFFTVLFLLAALHARAGVVEVETMEMSGLGPPKKPELSTTSISGDKARVDIGETTSMILDLVTGDKVWLNHADKTFKKVTVAQEREDFKKMVLQMHLPTPPASPPEAPKFNDTGVDEKVNGHDTRIFSSGKAFKFTCWVAKDVPDYAAINVQLKRQMEAVTKDGDGGSDGQPDPFQLDGIVVKKEVFDSIRGVKITYVMISAKVQAVDDKIFEIPAGYVEKAASPVK